MNAKLLGKFLGGAALAAVLASANPALAGTCDAAGARSVAKGVIEPVGAGASGKFGVDLAAGEGVLIDLVELTKAEPVDGEEGDEHSGPAQPGTALRVCDASGALVAPLASEVFAKGGNMTAIDDGVRLRFVSPAAGRYVIAVPAAGGARELLLRSRDLPATSRTVTELELGGSDFAKVSGEAPLVYSFTAKAGQWVKITATSENDTVLHLAAPTGGGAYEVIADNDDSDGNDPLIKRRLPATGTYFVQVESLTSETGDVSVLVQPTSAPPPPPAPIALKVGPAIGGKLESSDDKRVYSLPVAAGHTYRLELTAPYDAVVEVGMDNPLMTDDGEEGNGFSSIKSQDANLTGTEKLTFAARTSGRVLVQVRAFGLGDSDGAYQLAVVDNGM